MAKYIVELEDEPYMREDGVNYYTCKSARWYKLGETIINRLTPYTEPDRKAIEDEVWSFAWKIFNMDFGEYAKLFDDNECPSDYRETKAKYEEWKKQKEEEIHVGDEVFIKGDPHKEKAIVLRLYQPKMYKPVSDVLWADGSVEKTVLVEKLMCAYRHFDEVDELLEALKTK